MLINKNTKIIGQKVILVPYRKEHVLKYHQWMKSKELQQLTGSLPLTLEEEYEMQKSWMQDDNKCTFIILNRQKYEETGSEIDAMIGDTNLFFISSDCESIPLVCEAEIMIAEGWARGNHCGYESILLMLHYGIHKLNVKSYLVKILANNTISLHIFSKIGFIKTGYTRVFNEITMERLVDEQFTNWLNANLIYKLIDEEI